MNFSLDDFSRCFELLEIIVINGLKKCRGFNNSSVNELVKVFVNEFKELIEEVWEWYYVILFVWVGICMMMLVCDLI